jgi:formylglycine-generating enzyme required for sulfatase activity
MKVWIGLTLAILMFGSVNPVVAQSKPTPPSIKVICSVLAADISLTFHAPEGDKTVSIGSNPVPLQADQSYTLSVSKPGYTAYRKTFKATWAGLKNRSVIMERGIGPDMRKAWVVDLEDSVTMEFMPIPVGEFNMGSEEGDSDEEPVHLVSFSRPFWLAKTEVTDQQYQQYKAVGHKPSKNEVVMPSGAAYPVIWVSWDDANGFCKWLTTEERKKGRLPEGFEYTLPTEAEWEYACRAGSTEAYAGKLSYLGWYNKNSGGKINPVGLKNPNAWGLHDMHGNVWEWCADKWYANYHNAPVNGSQRGLAANEYTVDRTQLNDPGNIVRHYNGGLRVVRGGSWQYSGIACRSANRFYHTNGYKMNYLGFRPVLLWNPPTLSLQVTRQLKEK